MKTAEQCTLNYNLSDIGHRVRRSATANHAGAVDLAVAIASKDVERNATAVVYG